MSQQEQPKDFLKKLVSVIQVGIEMALSPEEKIILALSLDRQKIKEKDLHVDIPGKEVVLLDNMPNLQETSCHLKSEKFTKAKL